MQTEINPSYALIKFGCLCLASFVKVIVVILLCKGSIIMGCEVFFLNHIPSICEKEYPLLCTQLYCLQL